MKTFKYKVEYNEQETRTIATIDISETIKAIEEKYPGMLAAYHFLTGDIAFPTIKFTGVARLNPRDVPIPKMGRQFAVMKARRKAKRYLKKRFFDIQKAFSKASEDALIVALDMIFFLMKRITIFFALLIIMMEIEILLQTDILVKFIFMSGAKSIGLVKGR